MEKIPEIKLYGASGCHKTLYYQRLLKAMQLRHEFLDVKVNEYHAQELRDLYENKKLNYPTITIGTKKLRNPSKENLEKWTNKLIPCRLPIIHDIENQQFTLNINGEIAKVEYTLRDNIMFLVHSEVPYNLRGQGIGMVLVEKTFEQLTKEGYKAVAVCSFINVIARRNKKWNSIIGTGKDFS